MNAPTIPDAATVTTAAEDVRARGAIERMTDRIMQSPTPGTTRASARSFVVELALRADVDRPLHTLEPTSIPASEARAMAVTAVERALVMHPRVQRSIHRFTRRVAEAYPNMGKAVVAQYAATRFLDALMATPPLLELVVGLYASLMRLKVSRADAPAAVAELLNPEHLDAAVSRGSETSSPTITVDVPVAFDIHPAKELALP